jgi:hypothetical protein
MGSFGRNSTPETARIGEFGRRVFEIAELSRVSHTPHNLGVWVVGATGIEPVTPSMSTRCSPAELRALKIQRYRDASLYRLQGGQARTRGG